ncbi:dimethyl sulfoxide reductase anchor subunit family protein [Thiohalobacter thiocyanaticus]|uniref:DMSO reductase n=1 Tax=Thiohalobacter thiocyanaticus TaxID=585455 RepID=A0A426QIX8_9GAMM|nr:DmsC/YnfH family molybdoenzyme membrane anchor subunit [Thiohalobacter thiocyanaticus]RRQ21719.1 DMSO reductase [Thiohalobacter thiocyanaticus]
MHPAFSVIFLTTLSGVGQGLFLALYTGQVYAVAKVLPGHADTATFYGLGSLIALLFLAAGLLASFFHLGHPERGWRAIAQWRTSWLSREVIILPAFMGLVFLYGLIHYSGWNPVFFEIGQQANIAIDLSMIVGAITTVVAFGLFIATGMIYACIKFLQEWASPLTVINYTLLGSASGFTLATAYAAYHQAPGLLKFYGVWAIILTAASLITRGASLIRNARIKYKSTLQTAIGVRHGNIQQKSQGFMAGSFNTREFFHHKTAAFMKSIKWIFLLLVFPVPVALLAMGLSSAALGLLAAAFVVQYIGLIAERWFFFAQANHPQNLYYQTI